MEHSSPQERERLLRESALRSLSPQIEARIKKVSGLRSKPGSAAEALRLKGLRTAWNKYCQRIISTLVQVRIEVGQEYPALLEDEALHELQQEIIGRINATDIMRRKEAEAQFEASGLSRLLADHYLDVARLTAFAEKQITLAKTQREFLHYRSGLRFPAALQFVIFVALAATRELSWLGPPVVGLWFFRHHGPFLLRTWYSILGSFFMCTFFYPAVRDGLMMAMMRPAWTPVNPVSVALRGPIPGHLRFLMSNFTQAFVVIYFGSLFVTRLTILKALTQSQFALFISAFSVVLYSTFKLAHKGQGRKILLLRRFDSHLSSEAKDVLNPTLIAYGKVETADDKTLHEGFDLQTPGLPDSEPVEVFVTTGKWQEEVKKKIAESDLIVMDMSEISPALAWEFFQSVRHSEPRPIILVASARYLAAKRSTAFRDFVNKLKGLSDDAEALLASVEPPLAYSRSLVNLIFTVQLYRRIRRLAQLQHLAL
jgi:hypothetical protein